MPPNSGVNCKDNEPCHLGIGKKRQFVANFQLKGLIYKNLQNAAKGVWHLDQWYPPRSSVAPD